MKGTKYLWVPVLAAMIFTVTLRAAAETKSPAPHGGRLMSAGKLKVEFHLGKDRKANLYLYDRDLKPLPADFGKFTLWVISKSGAMKVPLQNGDSAVLSRESLPAHGGYPIVLAVKDGAKPVKLRFKLQEDDCGGCKMPEYACVCENH